MNRCFSIGLLVTFAASLFAQEAQLTSAIDDLGNYLNLDSLDWSEIAKQPFAKVALTKGEAETAKASLTKVRRKQLLKERAAEMKALEITLGDRKMPFFSKIFGDKQAGDRSLFISMHGGGGASTRVNNRQWNNQKQLYRPSEGVYVAPRAPTDTWNLWHEQHIMPMFDRLIENMILFEGVDPNRVYIMGYSAGGDGVYQLAPRMADRWAAAAMMAGHPNDAKPQNLRNIGFALYMGGKDGAYKRNKVAAEWSEKLMALEKADPTGYKHLVTIYPDKGHWMDGEDASSLPWMSQFTRDSLPTKIVWLKDGNPQPRFYWLGADEESWRPGEVIFAERKDQIVTLSEKPVGLSLLLNDAVVDLDKKLTVTWTDENQTTQPRRTIWAIHQSLTQRFDPTSVYTAVVDCDDL